MLTIRCFCEKQELNSKKKIDGLKKFYIKSLDKSGKRGYNDNIIIDSLIINKEVVWQ